MTRGHGAGELPRCTFWTPFRASHGSAPQGHGRRRSKTLAAHFIDALGAGPHEFRRDKTIARKTKCYEVRDGLYPGAVDEIESVVA